MRISLNLATRPFVELRPLIAKLRIALVGLVLLAVGLGFGLHALRIRQRAAEARMDALVVQTRAYQRERQQNEARMRQPQNMAVLGRAQFLNALFARKSFSWTAVMMDLERVLPAGVQVTSIEPVITKEGEVTIRLRVSGQRERAVQLIRNLELSQRFLLPRLSGEAARTQDSRGQDQSRGAGALSVSAPGDVEFEILSGYNPLPAANLKHLSTNEAAPKGRILQEGDVATSSPSQTKGGAR